ncbi:iron-sulfur cluster assembly protein HesB [Ignicoccus islandicus DSM 13165]|uniref:Iron-sulfur cluster assembly protein HesB n=1 Tax=Ignicoccus islandicus DSM 13165 TaxID=940295 RepID=A0A0U3F5U3_9CREN|nr:orotidine 5'-phosphate decarboxylase / HUMPS family protein [Ignicoccus islandicus]ALU11448.1 iron-sulfur cluster assembly protein HesB [Ignicoccus islandicus DSM 13165]
MSIVVGERVTWERAKEPSLQIALDFTDLERAVWVASKVYDLVDILEVGTPLIKSEGMKAVKVLKAFNKPVFADTKTCDTGGLEAELAFSNGADAMSVMAFADDPVISEAIEVARNNGKKVVADLMFIKDPVERAKKLKELGVEVVELHVGISQQLKYGKGAEELAELASEIRKLGLKVAIAGGLKPSTIPKVLDKADVIVVGGYVTKSDDPRKAVVEVLKAMGRL